MASIVKKYIKDYNIDTIYVVGGACCFSEFEKVFKKEIKIDTVKPLEPLLSNTSWNSNELPYIEGDKLDLKKLENIIRKM